MVCFGEILADLRQDRRLTQRFLAEVLHVSVGTISNYENGVHLPDLEKLVEIANYFDVTTDYLLGRTPYNISPSELQAEFAGGQPLHACIQELQSLTQDRQRALLLILEDMNFRRMIETKTLRQGERYVTVNHFSD